MKKVCAGLVLLVAVSAAADAAALQRRRGGRRPRAAAVRAPARVEPTRTLSGRMIGNKVIARLTDDRMEFDYTVTGAQVVDGKLQFHGTVSQPARAGAGGETASATLVGTVGRAREPWPWGGGPRRAKPAEQTAQPAPQPQGREARNPETAGQISQLSQSTQSTARTTQTPTAPEGQKPAGGEVSEQTQSLYTAIDAGSGCDVLYFKMQLPAPLAARAGTSEPVQLGVVLAPLDNKWGEQINQHVCRIVRALASGQSFEDHLVQLNRLLSGGR